MSEGETPSPPPPAPVSGGLDVQAAIESAQAQHLAWLGNLACALLWPDDERARAAATDEAGGFAGWVARHRDHRLVDQPTVLEAADLDTSLRRDAARLLAEVEGTPPPRAAFEALMRQSETYQARLTRLGRAFTTASAELDPLTGVHNRTTLQRMFHRENARLARTGSVSTVALADLDHFKQVNDTLGHAAGDAVLRHAADTLTTRLRPYDVVFRYGGEEFLILFPGNDRLAAATVLERLRQALASHPAPLPDGREQRVTASFGAAELDGETPWEHVIARADAALYRAKEGGRDQVVFWTPGDPEPEGNGGG